MHKEIVKEAIIELQEASELLDDNIQIGDIIGVGDNGNPISWEFYYVIKIDEDGKLWLSSNPNVNNPDIWILGLDDNDDRYFIHIPFISTRDRWTPNRELTLEQVLDQVFKLSYAEVHWTTRNPESLCEEIPTEIADREAIINYMDAHPRQFRRTRDGKYEYLVLTHPELAQPENVNRRGRAQQPQREPLNVQPPRRQVRM